MRERKEGREGRGSRHYLIYVYSRCNQYWHYAIPIRLTPLTGRVMTNHRLCSPLSLSLSVRVLAAAHIYETATDSLELESPQVGFSD